MKSVGIFQRVKKKYCKYNCHYLFIDEITNSLFNGYMSNSSKEISTDKTKIIYGMIYGFLLVICYIQRYKYQQNEVSKFFYSMSSPLINLSIKLLPIDSPAYNKKQTGFFPTNNFNL
jgi:phosphotransferase system  glucose/maltose/N-acetylglucosamine-specific IIC component